MSDARFDPTAIVVPESVGLCSERLERLNDLFRAYVDSGDLAGAATLIARHGRVAHLGSFGMAHREEGRPVAPDTLFRIASMTKPITSVAVMMLVEEGRVLLNDPVARYLPEFSVRVVTTHGPGYGFGLGFDVHTDPGLSGSPKGVGSYAWGGYWHTGFWVDPAAELFVITMAQIIPADHIQTGEKVPHLVYQALLD